MGKPKILLESWSPVCNIQAFVEETDTNCFLYLWFYPNQKNGFIKSCWVCNTKKAPNAIDTSSIKKGITPDMPARYVKHNENGIHIQQDLLKIIWFEEGDAAALLENGEILAVIPAWAGQNGFHGFAKHAKGAGPFAWELEAAEGAIHRKVSQSIHYWNYMQHDYWPEIQKTHMETLEKFWGTHDNYYAIDGDRFPPKALITGSKNNTLYAFTAGVSMLVQPRVEQFHEDNSADFRRIELGFAAEQNAFPSFEKFLRFMSALTYYPWQELEWLGHGHTVPCDILDGYNAVWLLNSNLIPEIDAPDYPTFMDERINLLWLIPLREKEYEYIQHHSEDEVLQQCKDKLTSIHIFNGENKLLNVE